MLVVSASFDSQYSWVLLDPRLQPGLLVTAREKRPQGRSIVSICILEYKAKERRSELQQRRWFSTNLACAHVNNSCGLSRSCNSSLLLKRNGMGVKLSYIFSTRGKFMSIIGRYVMVGSVPWLLTGRRMGVHTSVLREGEPGFVNFSWMLTSSFPRRKNPKHAIM
jgi:hypothetical protein